MARVGSGVERYSCRVCERVSIHTAQHAARLSFPAVLCGKVREGLSADMRCEREGGRDTIKPQVFSPALPLTLSLPPTLPSHFPPAGEAAESMSRGTGVPHSGQHSGEARRSYPQWGHLPRADLRRFATARERQHNETSGRAAVAVMASRLGMVNSSVTSYVPTLKPPAPQNVTLRDTNRIEPILQSRQGVAKCRTQFRKFGSSPNGASAGSGSR
jgi:hypothetical protein